MTKKLCVCLAVFGLFTMISGLVWAGLAPAKSEKFRVTGFASKQSEKILRVDTGTSVYRLDFKSVTLKNPGLAREIGSSTQVTINVESKDVVGMAASQIEKDARDQQ